MCKKEYTILVLIRLSQITNEAENLWIQVSSLWDA